MLSSFVRPDAERNWPPTRIEQHLKRLAVNAQFEKDPQQRAALDGFVSDLSQELGR